jgi:hypothetical protein
VLETGAWLITVKVSMLLFFPPSAVGCAVKAVQTNHFHFTESGVLDASDNH